MDGDLIRGREQIAEALHCSVKTVSRWIAQGHLPASKSGPFANSAIVVDKDEVDELCRRFRIEGADRGGE